MVVFNFCSSRAVSAASCRARLRSSPRLVCLAPACAQLPVQRSNLLGGALGLGLQLFQLGICAFIVDSGIQNDRPISQELHPQTFEKFFFLAGQLVFGQGDQIGIVAHKFLLGFVQLFAVQALIADGNDLRKLAVPDAAKCPDELPPVQVGAAAAAVARTLSTAGAMMAASVSQSTRAGFGTAASTGLPQLINTMAAWAAALRSGRRFQSGYRISRQARVCSCGLSSGSRRAEMASSTAR